MKWKTLAWLAGAWILGSYVYDVLIRPGSEARRARQAARDLGKPMLNVGAGTPGSSLRAALLGPQLVGDHNLDKAAPPGDPGPDRVTYGDVERLPYRDKEFGSAFTSHVLEHVDNPDQALAELNRVADVVVNVTPRWWAPHTWCYRDHQWYVTQDGKFLPLWRKIREENPKRVQQRYRRIAAKERNGKSGFHPSPEA